MPNETWQSDFTHYRLTTTTGALGDDVEIISWLDDCSRYALHVTAHRPGHRPDRAGHLPHSPDHTRDPRPPRSPTTAWSTPPGSPADAADATHSKRELRRLHIVQKNSRPNHPTTCGKVERFQQTMKKWLRAQPVQPAHPRRAARRSWTPSSTSTTTADPTGPCHTGPPPPRSTTARPKPYPAPSRDADTHDRIRHDRIDDSGCVTLRVNGKMHHIGIGRTHARTHVDPARPGPPRPSRQRRHRRTPPRAHHRPHQGLPANRSTQRPHPKMTTPGPTNRGSGCRRCLETSHGAACRNRTDDLFITSESLYRLS